MLEEEPCRVGISVPLEEYIDHSPVLVERSLQPVGDTTYDHMHFVEMPARTSAGFQVAWILSDVGTKINAPGADGLTLNFNSTL